MLCDRLLILAQALTRRESTPAPGPRQGFQGSEPGAEHELGRCHRALRGKTESAAAQRCPLTIGSFPDEFWQTSPVIYNRPCRVPDWRLVDMFDRSGKPCLRGASMAPGYCRTCSSKSIRHQRPVAGERPCQGDTPQPQTAVRHLVRTSKATGCCNTIPNRESRGRGWKSGLQSSQGTRSLPFGLVRQSGGDVGWQR
jgi:hypothetical protein